MKSRRILIYFFSTVTLLSIFFIWGITKLLTINPPQPPSHAAIPEIQIISDSLQTCGKSWIHLNQNGWYEMYVEGDAYSRGVITGKLSKKLIDKQERAFVNQLYEMIPSQSYLRFLRFLLAIFNQDIDTYIPNENIQEISGISQSASDEYQFIGNNFQRLLNYHGAHDIGHMLQNYHLVGCTSFAAWGDKSADSGLIIGRNFDFYVGDEFAEDKIINFIKPDSGFQFMTITWGGMTGVVSGMNEKGLTITINAAKSYIPIKIATPISIVARNILQYAKNIKEAQIIAASFQTFVAESLLIGSAEDQCAAIIEKSPYQTDLVNADSNFLICTNHFQGEKFRNDKQNIAFQQETPTTYRYARTKQLVMQRLPLDEHKTVEILRDFKGLNNEEIGYMNEMTVNQFLAHHSIIFKPEKLLVWISTGPYPIGKYICYDLRKIFAMRGFPAAQKEIHEKYLSLQSDKVILSEYLKNVPHFKLYKKIMLHAIHNNQRLSETYITGIIKSNPAYYQSYLLVGDYYYMQGDFEKANSYYQIAIRKKIPFLADRKHALKRISEIHN